MNPDRDTIGLIFRAVSDSTRLEILDVLAQLHGASASALARHLSVSRQAIAKHLGVLEDAGLVAGRRVGREIVFDAQPERFATAAHWLEARGELWAGALRHLKAGAESARPWEVLVILGASGVGKSTVAAEIARRRGVAWLQVDDLRLTLQFSSATLPERTDDLYFFERTPDIWQRPVAELLRGFIRVAEVMAPAVRTVVHSHVLTNSPMVIEGDGILPALAEEPLLRPLVQAGVIRFVGITTPDAEDIYHNLLARGRGIAAQRSTSGQRQAEANAAYGAWLESECRALNIPLVAPHPFQTLAERIREAT